MARSGQVTVTTAGTAVRGPDESAHLVAIAPHPSNSGTPIWVGDDAAGDVASTTGFPLPAGVQVVVEVSNLRDLWFDATTNGDKVCWLKLD